MTQQQEKCRKCLSPFDRITNVAILQKFSFHVHLSMTNNSRIAIIFGRAAVVGVRSVRYPRRTLKRKGTVQTTISRGFLAKANATIMTNIYVSAQAGPSRVRLSAEPQRPLNEFSATNSEQGKRDVQSWDINANELFVGAKKKDTEGQTLGTCGGKREVEEPQQTSGIKSPMAVGKIITGIHYCEETSNYLMYFIKRLSRANLLI